MLRRITIGILLLGLVAKAPAAELEVAADCGYVVTLLVLSPRDIRRAAPGMVELGKRLVIQPLRELWLRRSGTDFRQGDVKGAYDAMEATDFDAINGRQDWANWRLIPRALSNLIPATPVRVIDLGCGPGSSTKILSHFVHADSKVLGIDLAENLVTKARAGSYSHGSGKAVSPEFSVGSATETFRQADGTAVASGTVDYVNSSGIVGHYLDVPQLKTMAAEVHRVLKVGGYVALDNGPHLVAKDIVPAMKAQGFTLVKQVVLFPGDARGQLVFRRD